MFKAIDQFFIKIGKGIVKIVAVISGIVTILTLRDFILDKPITIAPHSTEIPSYKTIEMNDSRHFFSFLYSIYYTTNGDDPINNGKRYKKAFSIKLSDIQNDKVTISACPKFLNLINCNDVTVIEYEITEYKLGDLNNSGIIDSSDSSICLEDFSKLNTGGEITETEKKVGDVDKDGYVTSADASWILQYYGYASVNCYPMTFEEYIAENKSDF